MASLLERNIDQIMGGRASVGRGTPARLKRTVRFSLRFRAKGGENDDGTISIRKASGTAQREVLDTGSSGRAVWLLSAVSSGAGGRGKDQSLRDFDPNVGLFSGTAGRGASDPSAGRDDTQ